MLRALQNVLFSSKSLTITGKQCRRWCSHDIRDKITGALSSYCQRTHHCGELNSLHVGQQVELSGWLQSQRLDLFLILRDSQGTTQVTIPQEEGIRSKLGKCPRESIVRVRGVVQSRPEGQQNKKLATGDVEVVASDIEILNTARKDLPFQIQDFHKITEALRMRHRYLDLRNAEIQRNLRVRSQMVMKMREFLCNQNGFVEVETPTLFRSTVGGAREFVVPTHHKGKFYSLPQSPQQFKQLLMVGGIDRYMQIARCYRDETANPDRQPEFTQVDLEMSFVTPSDVKALVEGMLVACWPTARGQQLTAPFEVMTFAQAMGEYGVDKPDTRFNMKVQDVTLTVAGCDSQHVAVLKAVSDSPNSSVKAVNFKQAASYLSNKDIDNLKTQTKVDGVWNAVIKIKKESDLANVANLGSQTSEGLCQSLGLQVGDLLLMAAGRTLEASGVVGKQRVQVANLLESKGQDVRGDKDKMNFLWVEDFPLFMPKEDGSEGVESAHHPFTAPHPDDLDLIYSDPEKVRGLHYDLVLNGAEIGGGSIRIHNAHLQRYVLEKVLKEDAASLDHLLEALDSGCPPHGGIALGLDRLVAIVCGAASIRDVIAFPKSIDGKDSMCKAPTTITEDDRVYYHLPKQES